MAKLTGFGINPEDPRDAVEALIGEGITSQETWALLMIAIQLQRIADRLEKPQPKREPE